MRSHNRINSRTVSYFLAVLLMVTCIVVADKLQYANAISGPTGIIVPLYSYPGANWDKLIQEKTDYPQVPVIAIINPDNGPGTKDQNYVSSVQKLQSSGIIVLGYVYTENVDATQIRNYMGDYKNWYDTNGIFFDAMSNAPGNESFYKQLSDYAKSIGLTYTVGNPGTDTLPTYIGSVDNLVIHDSPALPDASLFGGWHENFTKSNFSIVSYDVNNINASYIENTSKYIQYIYVTDDTSPNPFNNLPNYIGDLFAMVDTARVQNETTVPLTVNAVSANGNQLNGFWVTVKSDKNNTSGFTPFSYDAVAGNQYAVTVSNFGNYTFERWDDNTTSNTRLVIPTQSTTLTAYYGINGTIPTNNTVQSNSVIQSNNTLQSGTGNLTVSQPASVSHQQSTKQPPAQTMGSVTVNIWYAGGDDRADYSFLDFKIYQDEGKTLYSEITHASGNPFDIDLLPVGHRYKIEVFANGMCSDIEYVDLEKTHENVNMYLPLPGGMRPHIFYNDGYTPISGAIVTVKSQDNKTWSTGTTDVNGETLRFWLEPTTVKDNYFVIQVNVGQHMSYSYSPAFLYPGYAQDINVVTPWPSIVSNMIAVKVYNEQSKLLSAEDGSISVQVIDNTSKNIAESKVNPRGEADFGNLKVGDYVFRAITKNGTTYGTTNATLDGTKTSFAIFAK